MTEPIEDSFAAELTETEPASIQAAAAEPIAVRVTRYRCPFCPRSWSRKAAAVQHIARCWNNPAVGNCKTCEHWQPHHWESEPVPGIEGAIACTEYDETCRAGVDISEGLRSGCPLWRLKTHDDQTREDQTR